jgi:uncharacterized membrane protein
MGFILFIIAVILFLPLTILNVILVLIKYGFRFKILDGYFYQTAYDIDRFANRNLRTLWNYTLIRYDTGIEPYFFGDERETISSCLGKNKLKGTLSFTGKILCKILDFLDPDHCVKSINNFD